MCSVVVYKHVTKLCLYSKESHVFIFAIIVNDDICTNMSY